MSLQATRADIVRLSLLALALLFGCAGALLAYTWRELDRAEAQQETELVAHKVSRNLIRLQQETAAPADWDEAYQKTQYGVDADWADQGLAAYLHTSFEHDLTLLISPDGALAYASRQGKRTPIAQDEALAAVIRATAHQVREDELAQRRAFAENAPRATRGPIARTVTVRVGDEIDLLGVATITPVDMPLQNDRPATVLVTGWTVDSHLLKQVADDIGISDLQLTLGDQPPAKGLGAVPLIDRDGRTLGQLTWRLERPGLEALREIGQPILMAFLLLGIVFSVLGRRVRRLLMRLDEQELLLNQNVAELTASRDLAQAASQAKSEFIANISHEIRTPLNGVLGMTQVLARDQLTEIQKARVQIIMQSGRALLAVVNDVLDMSKIEAGRVGITAAPFDLVQLVAEACQTYEDLASTKHLDLTWNADAVAGEWVGDIDRIRQILLNLIANAVKFTDQGGIAVEARTTAAGVAIAVRDDGVGIPAAKLPELFEKFSQVDGSASRRFGGAGLGLAISRRLALLMDGDIAVDSVEGQGSVFTLQLPLARTLKSIESLQIAGSEALDEPERRLRVLAAEDNATNRLLLEALLEPLDLELIIVRDGAEAFEAYRSQPFDLVLMDIQMPVMNGLDAARAIRQFERLAGRTPTPILALTANVMQHQLDDYAAAGLDDYIAKPIETAALYRKVAEALANPVCPRVAEPSAV